MAWETLAASLWLSPRPYYFRAISKEALPRSRNFRTSIRHRNQIHHFGTLPQRLCSRVVANRLVFGAVAIIGMFDLTSLFNLSQGTTLVVTVWSIGLIGSVYAIFGGLRPLRFPILSMLSDCLLVD